MCHTRQTSQILSHTRLFVPASMLTSCNIYRVDFHVCSSGSAKQSAAKVSALALPHQNTGHWGFWAFSCNLPIRDVQITLVPSQHSHLFPVNDIHLEFESNLFFHNGLSICMNIPTGQFIFHLKKQLPRNISCKQEFMHDKKAHAWCKTFLVMTTEAAVWCQINTSLQSHDLIIKKKCNRALKQSTD